MAENLQVLVKFVTKLSKELRVPETPVAVPVSLKRLGLSQIVNSLLNLEPSRPFDFLINDELLRKSLQQHLLDNELSTEATLIIEYIPAVVPPQPKQSTPHDDWVSCVGAVGLSHIVSGSYDGNIRLFNCDLKCESAVPAHADGVNALVSLPSSQGGQLLMSAGKDHRVALWRVTSATEVESCSVDLLAQFVGHSDAAEGVAVSPSGTKAVSCGWDGALLVWRTGASVVEEAREASTASTHIPVSAKKRKVGKSADEATAVAPMPPIEEVPISRLEGHLHCVSSVTWPLETSIYSGGWDHSVRRWDVGTGINTDTYNGSKVVSTVASCSSSPDVVAFGGSDKALRVWDSRSKKGEGLAVQGYASHTNWISCVSWSPHSSFHLATASHDQTVKMWDIRSAVPLFTLTAHTDKALCVQWVLSEGTLVSGGADCTMQMYTK
ncbi:hypothetical protein CEUSTIGMA_g6906.t1 [Chlamydomonas eustigma]|uniref:Ribosome biogenesis protein WDR12 homolog n=1 Tax=Chlamydomonas eustigma TaxID=1157962 RepID=A0A250X8R7_9CHLO|nr:hypothetical protein CEUSTIGMA_g6906.t1 [Chlamydomonas eustigma]|eukprot:GAX79465.1 hypothetical protein CEUSTIGMA_g6906.t1 [Chlamydomonas eustigma]